MRQEVEKMRHERSFQPDWALDVYINPLRVQPVHETQISPQELSQFQQIMKRNAVDSGGQTLQNRKWTATVHR